MYVLNINFDAYTLVPNVLYVAIRAYQQVKNISMVYSLHQIKVGINEIPFNFCIISCCGMQHIEDRNLLVGYIAMFLAMHDNAQELFLASSHPIAALEVG
jgi:hypothetical protein